MTTAPKSLLGIMREVALELRTRARSMGKGELPRFLYHEAAKLLEAMEMNHDPDRSRNDNVIDSGNRTAGDDRNRDRCSCRNFKAAGVHARGCEEWAPSPEEAARLKSRRENEDAEDAQDYAAPPEEES